MSRRTRRSQSIPNPRVLGPILCGALLVLAGCSSSGRTHSASATAPPSSRGTALSPSRAGGSVTVRLTNPFSSYNDGTADDSSLANQEVLNAVAPAVTKFDDHAHVVVDPNLVTVSKTSDLPLVVTYAFNPAAVWEDGQPVGCDDVYLAWIANNGATTATSDGGTRVSLFQTASTTGWEQVGSVDCSADGRTATLTYAAPFADWVALIGNLLPAHVVAAHAGLGSTAAIRAAYEAHDNAILERIATFWNTGFKTDKGVDPAIDLSAGPYRIGAYEPDASVTLVRNDRYWGPRPPLDSIVFRVVSDGLAQVQALANRELDVIQTGGAQPDALAQLRKLSGVTTTVAGSDAYETLNFNFQAPLLRDSAVRQAVAECVPRQDILDKLIKPTDPQATLQESRLFFRNQDGYTDTSGARFDTVDIAAARATLAADGWKLDGDVFAKNDQRLEFKLLHSATRTDEAQLIETSCAKAGISVVDDADPKWGPRLGAGQFDAVLFTWVTNPTLSSQKAAFQTPPSAQNLLSNYGDYSNPAVDTLMNTLGSETDPTKLVAAATQADTLLWNDLATIPLWQYPQVTAYSDNVRGVLPNPTQQGLTWNLETWTVN